MILNINKTQEESDANLLQMRMTYDLYNTPIPNNFIDFYLPYANPLYVMVYILGFRHCFHGNDCIGIKQLAEKLNISEPDIINAFKYWEKKEIIKIFNSSPDNFSIEFLPIEAKSSDKPEKSKAENIKINLASQPSYSSKEIDIYMERSDEIKRLFKSAENIFAKPLTYNELNMLLTFFEWYSLPIDVIETMLEYCVGSGKKGRNYLETVARDWSENGIDTIEKAHEYINSFTVYAKILKAFGISGKTPNKKQITFMKRWLEEYRLPMDVIDEACEEAFLKTGKASFEYAEKILKTWFEKNVQTLEDADKAQQEYKEANKIKDAAATVTKTKSKNRFMNYEQREWDYEKIERLAQENM